MTNTVQLHSSQASIQTRLRKRALLSVLELAGSQDSKTSALHLAVAAKATFSTSCLVVHLLVVDLVDLVFRIHEDLTSMQVLE
jgi:hypothetical protein